MKPFAQRDTLTVVLIGDIIAGEVPGLYKTRTMSSSKHQKSRNIRIVHSLNKDEEQFVTKRIKTVQQSLTKFGIQCPQIDEHKVSEQQAGHDKDPFPIYTVIDKGFKQHLGGDPWFEISPYEAGYSITGAFVNISKFGSQFQNGREIKIQPEMDMLYLQAVCGSIADGDYNVQYIWKKIKEFIKEIFQRKGEIFETMPKVQQLFMDLVEINLSALKGKDLSDYEKKIRATISELDGGECELEFQMIMTDIKLYTMNFTVAVCDHLKLRLSIWPFNVISSICKCAALWIWGRTYNYLYKRKDHEVPTVLQDSTTRDYEDAGMLLNSPYMSVLREERDIDLIISLDFSDGDPFETVKKAADMCRELKIPFPKVDIPSVKYPNDFYVFEGHGKVPTVIHIPLFNTVNCGDKIEEWRKKYTTFQPSYSPDMIDPLVDVAGKNMTNTKKKVLGEIIKRIRAKSEC